MKADVPHDGYTLTNGRKPRTGGARLHVQYRGGFVDRHEYEVGQLRWTDTGSDWDVVAVKRA